MERIYLDHNATTPLRPEAAETLWLARDAANPSSLHEEGRRARALVEVARGQVAALLGGSEGELVFTSGGTEAIAAAVWGVCATMPAERRELVVSTVEHSAVLEAVEARSRDGFTTVHVPVDGNGVVDPSDFERAIGARTALVALQFANPETGVVHPVEAVASICRRTRTPLLVDAVQAAGKIEFGPDGIPGDLVAVSSHKVGGPQGAGALRVRGAVTGASLIPGIQERRRRGGTEPVAALAAFGAAAAVAAARVREEASRLADLRRSLETRLRREPIGAVIHGTSAERLPNTILFSVPRVRGELLAISADLAGFAVSTGSACASGAVEPSHVLLAMGLSEEEAREAVRVSLGWSTTRREVDAFAEALPDWVRRARAARRS